MYENKTLIQSKKLLDSQMQDLLSQKHQMMDKYSKETKTLINEAKFWMDKIKQQQLRHHQEASSSIYKEEVNTELDQVNAKLAALTVKEKQLVKLKEENEWKERKRVGIEGGEEESDGSLARACWDD
ncbi:unnamed protein product [Moneuplotes crassus]|uniref:Uncharacterized protein n=1 Tax=Euplotes crassus TaxID=5936 RepID=A0AAD1Y0Y9_EUPCR|nr:unnamed protein product [Moneuplotes crassus]